MNRRTLLALTGGALTGLAGCSSVFNSGDYTPIGAEGGTPTPTVGAAKTTPDEATPDEATATDDAETVTPRELATPDGPGVATERVSNGEIALEVPVEAAGGPTFYARLYRGGRLYGTSMGPAYRDHSEHTFDSTAVTDYRALEGATGIEVSHDLSTSVSSASALVRIELPEGEPVAIVTTVLENTGENAFTINTPSSHRGTDAGLGQAELWDYGPNYRLRAQGHDTHRYDDVRRWSTFSLDGEFAWVSSFDDGRGVTYGLDGANSDTSPNLGMAGSQPEKLRLFGTAMSIGPGESVQIRTAVAAHHGGSGVAETGAEILSSVLSN